MRLKTVIFDLDGTLCDVSHRRHHVARKTKNWPAFLAGMHLDPVVEDVATFCQFLLYKSRVDVVFCTGRGEEYRTVTEEWLRENVFQYDHGFRLLMRPAGDSRADDIIKKEMLDQLRAEGHDIWFAVDDRQRVVDMWRANGVTVFQCAPGDFDTAPDEYRYEAIPGDCLLTLMVGPSGAGKSTFLKQAAEYKAIISSDAVREEMFGDFRSQEDNLRVFSYVHASARARLSHGLPVVIDATHLHRRDRLAAVALAPKGSTVEYIVLDRPLEAKLRDGGWRLDVTFPGGKNLIEKHHESFQNAKKDILRGDSLPNIRVRDFREAAVSP